MQGEEVHGYILDAVRDFASWLAPLAMHFDRAFQSRAGIETPHSFAFKQRGDLTAAEQQMLAPEGAEPSGVQEAASPKDVFISVKAYMRDVQLQQAPVMALPHARVARVAPEPPALVPRAPMSADAIRNSLKIAALCRDTLGMPRAAAALEDLVMKRLATFEPAGWLAEPGHPDRPPLPVGVPTFPHLPAELWRLCSKTLE